VKNEAKTTQQLSTSIVQPIFKGMIKSIVMNSSNLDMGGLLPEESGLDSS
jgi:hypothetical protein